MMWRKSPTHFNMAAAFRRRKDILTKLSDLENDSDYYCDEKVSKKSSKSRAGDDDDEYDDDEYDDDDEYMNMYMNMYRDYNFLCDNKFICEAMACETFPNPKPLGLIHPKNYQLLPKTMSSALASAPKKESNFSKEQKKVLKKWRAS